MEERDFIKEFIQSLEYRKIEISNLYDDFLAGKINVEDFEKEFRNHAFALKEDSDDMYYAPFNGCNYTLNDETKVKSNLYDD